MRPAARTPQHPVRRAAAACVLALGTLLALPATPAAAWTEGPCPDASGVTVVVDFAGFRDEVVVRCAPAPAESGYDALTSVGIDWTPTQRFPGMLCRIEGLPADDPCVTAPPPDAYWSYWRAEYGGSWAYSQYGPGTTSPAPGPVEGWRFSTGDDQPPRAAPPAAPGGEPSPSPTPSPTRAPSPTPTPAPTTPPPSPTPQASTAPPPPAPTSTPDTATSTPSDSTTSSPDATADPTAQSTSEPAPSPTTTPSSDVPSAAATTADELDDTATAASPADGGGPPVATLLGVGLVAAVGGAALWVDRRRRPSP